LSCCFNRPPCSLHLSPFQKDFRLAYRCPRKACGTCSLSIVKLAHARLMSVGITLASTRIVPGIEVATNVMIWEKVSHKHALVTQFGAAVVDAGPLRSTNNQKRTPNVTMGPDTANTKDLLRRQVDVAAVAQTPPPDGMAPSWTCKSPHRANVMYGPSPILITRGVQRLQIAAIKWPIS
jgi:hypothetical protein